MKHYIIGLSASLMMIGSALATPPPANLYTNVSNLASSDNTMVTINNSGEATAFTTGASSATLFAAGLLLDIPTNPTLVQQSGLGHANTVVGYDAYIYSNVSGAPGSSLYTCLLYTSPSPRD